MGYSPWGHKESDMTEQLNYSKPKLQKLAIFPAPQRPAKTLTWQDDSFSTRDLEKSSLAFFFLAVPHGLWHLSSPAVD